MVTEKGTNQRPRGIGPLDVDELLLHPLLVGRGELELGRVEALDGLGSRNISENHMIRWGRSILTATV